MIFSWLICRPLGRAATRLRGISSSQYPGSYVFSCSHLAYWLFRGFAFCSLTLHPFIPACLMEYLVSRISSCKLFGWWNVDQGQYQLPPTDQEDSALGCLGPAPDSHGKSSTSSDTEINRTPTSAQNWFLQHFSFRMLDLGFPDAQTQTPKSLNNNLEKT